MSRYSKKYFAPDRDQQLLLPPDLRNWVGSKHLSRSMLDVIEKMDLRKLYEVYESEKKEARGRPPFDPAMMLTLIFYCIAKGVFSSRGMERMTVDDIGARYIAGNRCFPDHASFAHFKIRHEKELPDVFTQVLFLCQQAGLIDLVHIAVDSTVIFASASAAKSVETKNLENLLLACQARAAALILELVSADAKSEVVLKKALHREELQEDKLNRAADFLKARDEVQQTLNQEAEIRREQAVEDCEESRRLVGSILKQLRLEEDWTLKVLSQKCAISFRRISDLELGKVGLSAEERNALVAAFDIPEDRLPLLTEKPSWAALEQLAKPSRINLTDPESYLTFRKKNGFRQCQLAQVATDSKHQVIVAVEVSQRNNDHPSLSSLVGKVVATFGKDPKICSADTGYASEDNFLNPLFANIDLFVKVAKLKPPKVPLDPTLPVPETVEKPAYQAMRAKMATKEGKSIYNRRAQIVEPAFGQIKHDRGFDRFLRIGHAKAVIDWTLVTTVHNLLKLFKFGHKLASTLP